MGHRRERGSDRDQWSQPAQASIQDAPTQRISSANSLDQAPTARYASAPDAPNDHDSLDGPMTAPQKSTRTLASATRSRLTARPDATPPPTSEPSRALAPLKSSAERDRAVANLNASSDAGATLIPGARRYRRPALSVVPRRSGPRSAITQFAVSLIVTAMLISALTLSTPLGQAAAFDVNGPLRSYSSAVPWLPTPTPTPKPTPKPATSFKPPAGANPGQQAVINEIIAVFGNYSQGALNIAKCESGYDPNAWNSYPILNSHASGVFQILYPSTWDSTSYASQSPFNATANINAAYQIFKRDGYSWREWQCKPY